MSKNQSPAEQSPLLINTLTSELIQHQGLNIINRPDGVTLAWQPQEGFNMNEAARENGFKNIRQDNYPQNGSGDAGSLVNVKMSHEEYDEFRQKPHLQSLKLAPIVPEATGNTLGQLTFMPSVSNVRAEYANPPEPPPEEQTPETDNSQPNEHLQTLIDESEDERSYWQRTKEGAASAWNSTQRIAEASWDNPGEFGKGVLKGVGNLPSDLWNLAVTASKAQNGKIAYSYLLDKMALFNYEDGNLARANSLASQSASILESGIVGDIFELDNDAQTGGSIASILVPVGTIVKAPASVAKGARGRKALDTAADTAKIADTSSDVLKADKTADPKIADTASNASTAKKTPDASAASKAKEPTGPAGNGGKVKKKQKVIRTAAQDRKEITKLSNEANVARTNGDYKLADKKLAEAREILKPHIPQKPGDTWDGFIERLDVSTPKDGATLWSGSQTSAQQFAESIGGSTLEGTPGGRVIDGWSDIKNIPWESEVGQAAGSGELWNGVSRKFANSATGEIHVIQTSKKLWDQGTVWHNIEKPIIRDSYSTGRITNVNMHVLNGKNQAIPLSENYVNDLLDLEGIPR
ncbi:hypothetical protein [uncultured Gilvimarinus sp.]|uniref:hypothetical protein n=1 Tax=uncultured Gilvimarinus sp. TaxID=1689143 RepID=UPI0030DA55D6